jgi:hypothetical protein
VVPPFLGADGAFSWNTAGSPIGHYEFYATVFDSFGSDVALLEVILVPFPGDYNGNGTVDAADYVVWRDSLGQTAALAADGDDNGIIDGRDYDVWRGNFGKLAGSGSVTNIAIPEPATLLMLVVGISWMFSRQCAVVS